MTWAVGLVIARLTLLAALVGHAVAPRASATVVAMSGDTPSDPPLANHAYYRACVGRWVCPFAPDVSDFPALRHALGAAAALGLWAMARWPRALGTPRLHTTVSYTPDGEVVHTTRATWFGLPLMRSRELIKLDPDGRHLRMRGQSRSSMTAWRVDRIEGEGEVNAETTRASYRIRFMGADMVQTTLREPNRVTLTQELPGYRVVAPLARVEDLPPAETAKPG